MADDMRYYITFYGIRTDDWGETFADPAFVDHHKLLVKEYISDGCDTRDLTASPQGTHKFLYPQHIKKTYFIEGTITGQITFAAYGGECTIGDFRVTLCKVHEDTTQTELFTTGWITVTRTLTWDEGTGAGEEIVYAFWIDAWNKAELNEFERIYLK